MEGHLVLEEWAGKEDGKKQTKMVVYVDSIEFLGSRGDGGGAAAEQPEPAVAKAGAADGIEEVPF